MRLRLTVLASVLLMSGSAFADSISAGAVSTFTLNPATDTVNFSATSENVASSGIFTQTGTFYVGNSGDLNQTIPFSFVDNITVNGVTESLTFTGQDAVTTGPDVLTINALGPVYFGATRLDFSAFTANGHGIVGQTLPLDLSAKVTDAVPTPEVSTMALLGTALIGLFFITRPRRSYSSWRGR